MLIRIYNKMARVNIAKLVGGSDESFERSTSVSAVQPSPRT